MIRFVNYLTAIAGELYPFLIRGTLIWLLWNLTGVLPKMDWGGGIAFAFLIGLIIPSLNVRVVDVIGGKLLLLQTKVKEENEEEER